MGSSMVEQSLMENIINSGRHYQGVSKEKYRINFINIIILLALPLFLSYALMNAARGNTLLAVVDSSIFTLLLVTFLWLRQNLCVRMAANIILALLIPIYVVILINGGLFQSGFFWFFFYPIFTSLLKGNRKGIPWMVLLVAIIIGYYLIARLGEASTPYDISLLPILAVALIIESVVVAYYELIRKRYNQIIMDQNSRLNQYQTQLESRVKEAVNENITLNNELIDIQRDIIFTMGSIGENRSEETGNHVKRVAEYTRLFAQKLGMGEEECDMLALASPMHDIGKVAIPDKILNKPARLTEEEAEIMRRHAQLGYNMLKNSKRSLLKMAATIAYEHHERWDGQGYPNALKGEEIHIYGRITAVADVFDALSFERVYKKAWEDEKVFGYLKEQSGKHFDPKLITIFFDHLDEFLEIRNRYRD